VIAKPRLLRQGFFGEVCQSANSGFFKTALAQEERPNHPRADRRKRRPQRHQLFSPAHPELRIKGNGKKYYLHLLTPEQLRERGMGHRREQLVIETYPVVVLSDE